MNWQLQGDGNRFINHKSTNVWKTQYGYDSNEKDLAMLTIMNLARQSSFHKVKREDVWRALLKNIWSLEMFENIARIANAVQVTI